MSNTKTRKSIIIAAGLAVLILSVGAAVALALPHPGPGPKPPVHKPQHHIPKKVVQQVDPSGAPIEVCVQEIAAVNLGCSEGEALLEAYTYRLVHGEDTSEFSINGVPVACITFEDYAGCAVDESQGVAFPLTAVESLETTQYM